jgi:hypothetical protein
VTAIGPLLFSPPTMSGAWPIMETPVLDGLTGASDGGPRMAAWASTNNSRGIGREGQVCVQMSRVKFASRCTVQIGSSRHAAIDC